MTSRPDECRLLNLPFCSLTATTLPPRPPINAPPCLAQWDPRKRQQARQGTCLHGAYILGGSQRASCSWDDGAVLPKAWSLRQDLEGEEDPAMGRGRGNKKVQGPRGRIEPNLLSTRPHVQPGTDCGLGSRWVFVEWISDWLDLKHPS